MTTTPQTFAQNAGQVPPSAVSRTAQIVNTIIQPGQTLPIYQAGQAFYIVFASGQVAIRPANGTWADFTTGTGVRSDPLNNFDQLEVQNKNAFAVVLSLWVGFGDYIDNRINLAMSPVAVIAVPQYDQNPPATYVDVDDLSSTLYTDYAGNQWLLISRASLLVSVADLVNAWGLYRRAGAVIEGTAFLLAHPAMSINVDVQGQVRVRAYVGAPNLVGTIAELYNAIPA